MSELGTTFKNKREELNLSLSEASLSTKIGARMLAAIEEGDFKMLPALPFAKGFVRAYANYLKLDADKMVALYLDEIGETPEAEPIQPEIEKVETAPVVELNNESAGMYRFFIIGGVIFLIIAIVGVKSVIDKYKKEGDISNPPTVAVSPIENNSEDSEEPNEAETADVAPKEEEPKSAETVTEETTPTAPAATSGTLEEEPPAPASVAVESTPPPSPEPTTQPEPAPAQQSETTQKKQIEILLEALDRVQITLSVAGDNRKVSLDAGEVHVLRTDETVQLDISDGGAINLVVNGQNRGVPGSLGQRKKVQLP